MLVLHELRLQLGERLVTVVANDGDAKKSVFLRGSANEVGQHPCGKLAEFFQRRLNTNKADLRVEADDDLIADVHGRFIFVGFETKHRFLPCGARWKS